MKKERKTHHDPIKEDALEKEKREKKIDEQLEQTFPASDPPSFIQPGSGIDKD